MLLTNKYYQNVKDYLHPHIQTFVNHYRDGKYYTFSRKINRKIIKYELGEQCIKPSNKPYWKKSKR